MQSFCIFLGSNNQLLFKSYYLFALYIPLVFIRSNSSYCQLMELFKSKESFKKTFGSDNSWKPAWSIFILGGYLFLILSLGSVSHFWVLWESIQIFTQMLPVHFLFFYFKWIGVNLAKMRNELLTLPHAKQKTKEQKQK